MFDEEPARGKFQRFTPAALQDWSETDLQAYIAELKEEIARAEAAIQARAHQRAAADAFFRKSG
ncbi:DUF1192 family protein [Roseococcus pinisoli]|uniref:DUF1192 family protein n=1 Tax=Roseococcus pinisoli TaxID=2835040 RepID=A0ABS5QAM0_9PROT|nr:DUF1192 family protein [Roseococcus pinisoli]MBS7809628.1 DUF1192 family protein [Roseococcus pinisoli]